MPDVCNALLGAKAPIVKPASFSSNSILVILVMFKGPMERTFESTQGIILDKLRNCGREAGYIDPEPGLGFITFTP